jgi:hypothetical protein
MSPALRKSPELASSRIGFRKRLCNRMWQLPMVLDSTRLKGARGISSSTRVLATRLPCEDPHTMHGEIWACYMTSLCLYSLLFLSTLTYTLTIFTVIFPDAADDTFDVMKITNTPTTHGLRVSWGPVTRSSDIDRKHLNQSR